MDLFVFRFSQTDPRNGQLAGAMGQVAKTGRGDQYR